jgi:predicted nucleotidyltransferase
MRRDTALALLEEHREEIVRRFQVTSLRLFGSVARDEAEAGSDVDVLVEFSEAPSLVGFMRLRFFLEDLLGCTVDLVTEGGLKERARADVERDAVRLA